MKRFFKFFMRNKVDLIFLIFISVFYFPYSETIRYHMYCYLLLLYFVNTIGRIVVLDQAEFNDNLIKKMRDSSDESLFSIIESLLCEVSYPEWSDAKKKEMISAYKKFKSEFFKGEYK